MNPFTLVPTVLLAAAVPALICFAQSRPAPALDGEPYIHDPSTVFLLRDVPPVLEHYRHRWSHLFVDEYQDTNHAQYLMVSLLAETHRNLTVVGDDDQSVYRFRGADIRNILEFQKDFPDAHVVTLEQNYRSSQPILDTAHAVIRVNQDRAAKRLWTERGG